METARLLEGRSATSKKVLQVCDNLNMHAKGAFYEAFEPQWAGGLVRRIEFHHTPKHGRWLNATSRGVDWQRNIHDARTKLKSVYPTNKL